jgi:hypothetical protein
VCAGSKDTGDQRQAAASLLLLDNGNDNFRVEECVTIARTLETMTQTTETLLLLDNDNDDNSDDDCVTG